MPAETLYTLGQRSGSDSFEEGGESDFVFDDHPKNFAKSSVDQGGRGADAPGVELTPPIVSGNLGGGGGAGGGGEGGEEEEEEEREERQRQA